MKFTRIPADTMQHLTINAGVLATDFNLETGEIKEENLLGATTGGITFNAVPEYSDYGEDVDNCPKNTKELKRVDDWTITMSGTLLSVTVARAKMLAAAADVSGNKVTPRDTLDTKNDFFTVWLICDYSNVNTGASAGYIAIKMTDALSTGGFQLQTTDKAKGQFAFELTAHYSIDAQDTVPFEIYIQDGGVEEENP